MKFIESAKDIQKHMQFTMVSIVFYFITCDKVNVDNHDCKIIGAKIQSVPQTP